MKALITLTAATATLGFMMTTGAQAQEPMWTGCHVAASVGMGSVDADVRFGSYHSNLSGTGANWGAGVGCDVEVPDTDFLIGVFADYTWLNLDSSNKYKKMEYDGQWTVGGRVGTFLTPRTLGYLLVGYSEMDASKLRVFGSNVGGISDFSGVTVGGGLETDISNNLRLGLEYRYYDYDGDSAHKWGKTISLDPEVQTVQLRLKWQLWTPTGLVPVPLK